MGDTLASMLTLVSAPALLTFLLGWAAVSLPIGLLVGLVLERLGRR